MLAQAGRKTSELRSMGCTCCMLGRIDLLPVSQSASLSTHNWTQAHILHDSQDPAAWAPSCTQGTGGFSNIARVLLKIMALEPAPFIAQGTIATGTVLGVPQTICLRSVESMFCNSSEISVSLVLPYALSGKRHSFIAAEAGHPAANFNLGVMHGRGDGVAKG